MIVWDHLGTDTDNKTESEPHMLSRFFSFFFRKHGSTLWYPRLPTTPSCPSLPSLSKHQYDSCWRIPWTKKSRLFFDQNFWKERKLRLKILLYIIFLKYKRFSIYQNDLSKFTTVKAKKYSCKSPKLIIIRVKILQTVLY